MKYSLWLGFVLMSVMIMQACGDDDSSNGSVSDTDADTDTDTDTDADADSDADADTDADSDADADSDSDTDTDTDTEVDTASGFETTSGIGLLSRCTVALNGECLRTLERTEAEVCDRWKTDMAITILDEFWRPGTGECDPGTVAPEAYADALRRTNFYRWIAHLQPFEMDPDEQVWKNEAACAVVTAYNESPDPHHPLETATCYSEEAYEGASSSSVGYTPYVPALVIDRMVVDTGDPNAGTLGHRRAMMAYYYNLFAMGCAQIYAGTSQMEGGSCIRHTYEKYEPSENLIDRVSAYPPPGIMPHDLILQDLKGSTLSPVQWHLNIMGVAFEAAVATVYKVEADGPVRLDDETGILTEMNRDGSGIWIQPAADPEPGEYVVDIEGTGEGNIGYRVFLSDCGTGVPKTCDLLTQNCGAEWLGCYRNADNTSYCMHRGYVDEGSPCRSARFCEPGLVCLDTLDGTDKVCTPYCDDTTSGMENSCDVRCDSGVFERVGEASACKSA